MQLYTTSKMKLPLTRPKALIDPRKLPLPLGKALGDTSEQAPQNPYLPLICGMMTAKITKTITAHLCQSHTVKRQMTQSYLSVNTNQTQSISTCQMIVQSVAVTASNGMVSSWQSVGFGVKTLGVKTLSIKAARGLRVDGC